MRDQNDSPARPNGPLSAALRLGCAFLACVGIAAARTPVGAADDAASRLRAPEQAVGPAMEAAPERDAALASPEGASLRQARHARADGLRWTPVVLAPRAGLGASRRAAAAPSVFDPLSVPTRRSGVAAPRGPPASA